MVNDLPSDRSAAAWDQEYRSGRWSYLDSPEQAARYAFIAGLCNRPGTNLLDIGCGEAILAKWLHSDVDYYGIDISAVALATARVRCRGRRARLDNCDAETFIATTTERFDTIVFNEMLYYCVDPIRLLENSQRLVTVGGAVVVSVSALHMTTWRAITVACGEALRMVSRLADVQSGKEWHLAILPKVEACQ